MNGKHSLPFNIQFNMRHAFLLLILVGYLGFGIALTQRLHFSRALDEGYHLELVSFIKQNGRLPIMFEERLQMARADLPLLYHVLVALLPPKIDPDSDQPELRLYKDSFRYQVIDAPPEHRWSVDTEDLTWPYAGQFLAWQIGRGLSLLLGAATVVVLFLLLQEVPLGERPWTSLFGAAFLAFTPRYLILSSALNDDTLLGLTAAVYFWMLIKIVKSPLRWLPVIMLGAALGVSMTIKYSLALLPLEIVVVLGLLAWQHKLGWLWLVKRLAAIGGAALLCSSWWFGWNIWYFNTVAEDGVVVGVIRALFSGGYNATLNSIGDFFAGGELDAAADVAGASSATYAQWLRITFTSFWGFAIDDQIPLSPWIFFFIGLVLLTAAWGLWRLWRRESQSHRWLLLTGFHILLLCVIPVLRFATSGRLGQTAQGRHILIPAAAAIIALLAWGLAAALPQQRWQRLALAAIVAVMMVWSGAHFYRLAEQPASLLPMRTVAYAADWLPQSVEQGQFGEGIELVSYALTPHPDAGQLTVELAWRSLGFVNQNYLVALTLTAADGTPVSQWIGYHGAGQIPTLAWTPGDTIFDRLVLPLPNLSPGDYQLQVQVLADGAPLPLPTGADTLTLGPVTLDRPSSLSLPQQQIGETPGNTLAFSVWQAAGPDTTGTPHFRYPHTISLVVDSKAQNRSLSLVDDQETNWSPTHVVNGVYTFVIGPRWITGDYRLAVDDAVSPKPVVSVENERPRHYTLPPEIETPLAANFANQILLAGYTLPQKTVIAGQSFPITFYWQAPERSPQADFIQFNTVLDSSGTVWGGYERLPLEDYSTLLWTPGEVVVDGYAVPVEADAPPGEYYLDVGYYIVVGGSAVNLPLVIDGEMSDTGSVSIGPIEVVAP